jgi:hypothetical protein
VPFRADPHLALMSQRAAEVLRKRRLAALPSGQIARQPGQPSPQLAAQHAARRAQAHARLDWLRPVPGIGVTGPAHQLPMMAANFHYPGSQTYWHPRTRR